MDNIKETKIFQEPALVKEPHLIQVKTIKQKYLEQMRQHNYKHGDAEIPGDAVGYAQFNDSIVFLGGDNLLFRMAAIDIVQFMMGQYVAPTKKLEVTGEEYGKLRDKARDAAWEWIYDLPQLFAD